MANLAGDQPGRETVERARSCASRKEDYGNRTIPEVTMDTHVKVDHKRAAPNEAASHANDMCALGELICRLNPYTKLPNDPTTGLKTAGMEVQSLRPRALTTAAPAPSVEEIIANIAVELVRNYGERWTFKGQTFAVNTAVRIPYRFKVTTDSGEEFWQTENLLIGYAGGDGPG